MQNIVIAIRRGNAASVMGTFPSGANNFNYLFVKFVKKIKDVLETTNFKILHYSIMNIRNIKSYL